MQNKILRFSVISVLTLCMVACGNKENNTTINKLSEGTATYHSAHTVKAGETIYGLAKNFNITQEALLAANPELENSGLKAGQVINIPVQGNPCPEYFQQWKSIMFLPINKKDKPFEIFFFMELIYPEIRKTSFVHHTENVEDDHYYEGNAIIYDRWTPSEDISTSKFYFNEIADGRIVGSYELLFKNNIPASATFTDNKGKLHQYNARCYTEENKDGGNSLNFNGREIFKHEWYNSIDSVEAKEWYEKCKLYLPKETKIEELYIGHLKGNELKNDVLVLGNNDNLFILTEEENGSYKLRKKGLLGRYEYMNNTITAGFGCFCIQNQVNDWTIANISFKYSEEDDDWFLHRIDYQGENSMEWSSVTTKYIEKIPFEKYHEELVIRNY
jgi:LysM repeat protein